MNRDMKLPEIDDQHNALKINGRHGMCRSYYQPDEPDIKTLEYARKLLKRSEKNLWALDLGCSPYFPESQRLAELGFHIDACDLEKPIDKFDEINKHFHNRIHYKVKNIATLAANDLRDDYKVIYSNRCFSFLTYQQIYHLIRVLIGQIKPKARFFLSFHTQSSVYANNYPSHLSLESRFVPLNNSIARENEMLAPMCLYMRDEIIEKLLQGLSISIIEEIVVKIGFIKNHF